MKKILICCFTVLAAGFLYAQQDVIPAGHAKLVVTAKGKQPKTYLFLDKLGYTYNCTQSDNEIPALRNTEIYCSGSFQNGKGDETNISINITIEPSKVGTFILRSTADNTPQGNIVIDFNNVGGPDLQALHDGTSGTVTITNYPAVGGNLTGTFKARLYDESEKKSGYYDVEGSFNVRRVE